MIRDDLDLKLRSIQKRMSTPEIHEYKIGNEYGYVIIDPGTNGLTVAANTRYGSAFFFPGKMRLRYVSMMVGVDTPASSATIKAALYKVNLNSSANLVRSTNQFDCSLVGIAQNHVVTTTTTGYDKYIAKFSTELTVYPGVGYLLALNSFSSGGGVDGIVMGSPNTENGGINATYITKPAPTDINDFPSNITAVSPFTGYMFAIFRSTYGQNFLYGVTF